jgi:hypothetical protein
MQQRRGEEGLGVEVHGRSGSSVAAGGFLPPLWWRRGRDKQVVLAFSSYADEVDDMKRFGRCPFLHGGGVEPKMEHQFGAPVGEHLSHKQCLCKTHFDI